MIGATVCSGIGAPELAMPWVDWRLCSEIEKFPRAVLEQRFGAKDIRKGYRDGHALCGDFTALRMRHLVRLGIPIPDLIVAGTPCQSFSIAGLRGGLSDARGNLTLSFVRLVNAIDNLRRHRGLPGLIGLWENVPGILNHGDNPFGCFLAALAGCDAALVPPGRGRWTDAGVVVGPARAIAWRTYDAQFFGLAQRRERVFVVFGPRDWPASDVLLPVTEGVRRDHPPRREAGERAAGTITRSLGERGAEEGERGTLINSTPDGIAGTVSSKWAKGTGGPAGDEAYNLVAHALRADGFDANEDGTGRGTPLVPVMASGCGGSNNGGIGSDGDPMFALDTTGAQAVAQPIPFDTTQITHPENRSNPQPGDPAPSLAKGGHAPAIAFDCKAGGNTSFSVGETPGSLRGEGHGGGHAAVAFSCKDHGADAGDTAPTLRAMGHDGSHANAGGQVAVAIQEIDKRTGKSTDDPRAGIGDSDPGDPMFTLQAGAQHGVGHNMQVRRLTPRECEKLQGLPPDWTAITYRGKPAAAGPRYKSIGNSMAVPCIAWIGDRIRAVNEIVKKKGDAA